MSGSAADRGCEALMDLQERQIVRGRWTRMALLLILGTVLARFAWLQLIAGARYSLHSEANAVRRIPVTAARGRILDCQGRVLAGNRPSYSLFAVPHYFLSDSLAAVELSRQTGMTPDEIQARMTINARAPFRPVRLLRDMDMETLTRLEEGRARYPGLYVQVEPVRDYSDTLRATHVLGYVGEANAQDLSRRQEQGLALGDLVGKRGVEKQFDQILRGQRGYRLSLVDALGRELEGYGNRTDIKAVNGKDLKLSLDARLQAEAEKLLKDRAGSVVAVDLKTGGLLAMASAPDYPLAVFARHLAPEVWQRLMQDPARPLLNRPLQAQLPPGSTYKIVSSLAGFDAGVLPLRDSLNCTGGVYIGRRRFPCWKNTGHGLVDFTQALAQSCNSYFYTLSGLIDLSMWQHWGHVLGFGQKTAFDLDEVLPGLLPDKVYMDAKYGIRGWGQGHLANLLIGQGDLLATPLQLLRMTALVATDGHCPGFHVVSAVETDQGDWHVLPGATDDVALPVSALKAIKAGMLEAVSGQQGSARAARVKNVAVLGKTGSAQNPHGDSHAWFVGYAPLVDPVIALVVVVENGGSGGGVAAPLAGELFRVYFRSGDDHA